MKRLILIFNLILILFGTNLQAITREDIMQKAAIYANHNWIVKQINPRYALYRFPGSPITGVAYSFGNCDNVSSFQFAIAGGKIPRNWAGNYSWQNHNDYTGIDCAFLVRDCLGTNTQIINDFTDNCLKIDISKIKSGDIVAKNGEHRHIKIAINRSYCYQAVGSNDTNGVYQKVMKTVLKNPTSEGYNPFSPFPQFDYEDPADGAVVDSSMKLDSISVTIYGKGKFTRSNISMSINGQIENNTVVKTINDTSVQLVSYDSTYFDSLKGEVNVEVTARANSIKLLRDRQLPVGTVEMVGICV